MTAITWDKAGDRRYETGVDRGILFLTDGRAVPWNGITGVEDATNRDANSFYVDGVKYLERQVPGDFAGTLKAFTYPDEFNEINGDVAIVPGLNYRGQRPKSFNLSYRSKIGNDADGIEHGYKLHILYNLLALPSSESFSSIGDNVQASEFSWALSSTPPVPNGFGPTAHVIIDSTKTDADRLAVIEDILYGNDFNDPWLPSIDVLGIIFASTDELIVIDNGNGVWIAVDPSDTHISFADPTTFQINDANAIYLNADVYQISNTP